MTSRRLLLLVNSNRTIKELKFAEKINITAAYTNSILNIKALKCRNILL